MECVGGTSQQKAGQFVCEEVSREVLESIVIFFMQKLFLPDIFISYLVLPTIEFPQLSTAVN